MKLISTTEGEPSLSVPALHLRKGPIVLTETVFRNHKVFRKQSSDNFIQYTDLVVRARKCDACLNMAFSRMLTCASVTQQDGAVARFVTSSSTDSCVGLKRHSVRSTIFWNITLCPDESTLAFRKAVLPPSAGSKSKQRNKITASCQEAEYFL